MAGHGLPPRGLLIDRRTRVQREAMLETLEHQARRDLINYTLIGGWPNSSYTTREAFAEGAQARMQSLTAIQFARSEHNAMIEGPAMTHLNEEMRFVLRAEEDER